MTSDPFAMFDLPRSFRVDIEALEKQYRALQRALHPDRFAQASASERQLSMQKAMDVNEGYRVLKDPLRRAEALLPHESAAKRENRTSGGALMFEMMELQEALTDAKTGSDEALRKSAQAINNRYQAQLERLAALFDDADHDAAVATEMVDGLRYLTRLRDEAQRLQRAREDAS